MVHMLLVGEACIPQASEVCQGAGWGPEKGGALTNQQRAAAKEWARLRDNLKSHGVNCGLVRDVASRYEAAQGLAYARSLDTQTIDFGANTCHEDHVLWVML